MKLRSRAAAASLFAVLALTAVASLFRLLTPSPPTPADPPAESPTPSLLELKAGELVEGQLSPGERHLYELLLEADQYLDLVAEQRGVDVRLRLLDDYGNLLTDIDTPSDIDADGLPVGSESLLLVAPVRAVYRLEVEGLPGFSGRYALEVLALRPAAPGDRHRVEGARLFAEADVARRARSLQRAAARYRHALDHWTEEDLARRAATLYWLGWTHAEIKRFPLALEFYEQAVPLLRETGNRRQLALALSNLGLAQHMLGSPEFAIQNYRWALAAFEALGDTLEEARTRNKLGLAFAALRRNEDAIDQYHQVLALTRDDGGRAARSEEAQARQNLGASYHFLGHTDLARDYLDEALQLWWKIGDRSGEAATLTKLAAVYWRGLDDPETGLDLLSKALELRQQVRDRRGEAVTLNDMGLIYDRKGFEKEARLAFDKARKIFDDLGDLREQTNTRHNLARLERFRNPARALELFRKVRQGFHSVGDRQGEAQALWEITYLLKRQGDLATARSSMEEALAIVESLRREPLTPELRATYFASVQEFYELHVAVLMDLENADPDAGYKELALEASERGRGRSLLERLAEAGLDLDKGIDPGLLERETELRQELNKAIVRRRQARSLGAEDPRVAREVRRLLNEADGLAAELRRRSPLFQALDPPEPLGVAEIRRQVLDEDTALLEYSLGSEGSFLFVLTREDLRAYELPSRSQIEEVARRANELLLDPSNLTRNRRSTELALAELSRLILGPVSKGLAQKRWLIASDGVLQYIPFAALPVPGPRGDEPLMVRYQIVHLSSASALAVLRRRGGGRQEAPKKLAVIAPEFEAGGAGGTPAALEHAQTEARVILDLVPAEERSLVADFATGRPLLRQYKILHFATHGDPDPVHPQLSGLFVPQGGSVAPLHAQDIFDLDLNADLVVLSACETALGDDVEGEGLVGITQGFLYAGAQQVVASLWQVDDLATARLMERFYRGLLEHDPPMEPAEALRQAQESMWEEEPYRHPYHWAGFLLQGEWRWDD